MPQALDELLPKMTDREREEVATFAAFLLAQREPESIYAVHDDITGKEMRTLAVESGSFDWLAREEENIYSLDDGDTVQWPDES